LFLQKQVSQFARWFGQDAKNNSRSSMDNSRPSNHRRRSSKRADCSRQHLVEAMESRCMMAADLIQIGAVFIEEDLGSDLHGDTFQVTFQGGAPGTQLTRLVIDGDLNTPGFSLGDLFFDTAESGFGADHAYAFHVEQLQTANPSATVKATVQDGSTRLVLEFTNFVAGDKLIFSIDVDEVQSYDPSEKDLQVLNDGFDPITSGVEFQNSLLQAEFSAPHYEIASGQDKFLNRYDTWLTQSGLSLPADNEGGKRDRTAGGGFSLQQIPKPVSLAGTIYVDSNEDLTLQANEQRLSGVKVDLYRLENGVYVATGHSSTSDSQGRYSFGSQLGLQPGTYQVRESQPAGYYSVGATAGRIGGGAVVGQTVAGNPDMLTKIDLLLGDQHATELNFAENLPSSISGHVCVVLSGFDCFSSSSEKAPLEGVLIELRNASGQVISTQRTGADGSYQFTNLRSGVYSLTEITPSGVLEGDAKVGSIGGTKANGSSITQIVIGGGVEAIDYDFCELTPSDLSGTTYYDQNNNGRRDSGETPLANVMVTLWDNDGNQVAVTRTNAQGFYRFTNLRPGTYRLTEQTPADYIPGRASVGTIRGATVGSNDASGDVIAAIALPAGSQGINYDFGEILPGSISGHVISDINGNCILDATGEIPLAGVIIELLSPSGTVLQTTLTDSQGNYRFDELLPGEYSVREVQPAGYFQGDQHAGSGGGDDSTADLIKSIFVGPGEALFDYNFCEIPPASIGGTVFVDIDQDCVYDADEAPLAGVTITLVDMNGNVVATTQTNANGQYEFTGLRPGEYSIRETQPAGYLQGGQRAGSGGGDDSQQDIIRSIDVTAGSQLVDYDFCEIPPASISGTVFVDQDEDNFYDAGETPIAGVTIELLNASGTVVASTTTDAQGNYTFGGLSPGRYAVRETQPLGYFQGNQRAGTAGGDTSVADLISAIDIIPGAELQDYDFNELLPGSIAGIVFADLDFDCIRDSNEETLAGVRIELLDSLGNVVATTLTGTNGAYTFGNLRPGSYTVRETQPTGYFQGGQMAPATGGDASIEDLISGISVGSGQEITEANFCEVPPAQISGYVFQDGPVITNASGEVPDDIRAIRDGLRTSDDRPIAGVTVQLRTLTGLPLEASRALGGSYTGEFIEVQTDANGYFVFTGLRSGTYHIYQQQPDGFADSLDTPGTTTGFAINRGEAVPEAVLGLIQLSNPLANPGTDAILAVSVEAGQTSSENNFSEVIAKPVLPPPPIPQPPLPPEKIFEVPPVYQPQGPITADPLLWSPLPLIVGYGHEIPQTWHLSIINGGYPRGMRNGEPLDEATIARNADRLDVNAWTVRGLQESTWRIVSTNAQTDKLAQRMVFDLPGAQPLAGDFNGDGYDEIALFVDGEWFIDANANGRWDEHDIWLRLGARNDQPVVGDWDGDGKDDVGIFGRKWQGDERALAAEPGLPDPDNLRRNKPKNVPPTPEQAPDDPRLLQKSHRGQARADLIDHVFRFGSGKDLAISGDFNGDGIASVGTFQDGKWRLDIDGDGLLNDERDQEIEFGRAGDIPLVGDFDGDGLDELAIVRGKEVIVDSNGNGHIDATDQVFMLESDTGSVIVGDFDGDGRDEPALHQSADQRRTLEARRAR
jgi:protocatechuate 3,4-dioxygenase beta subunit